MKKSFIVISALIVVLLAGCTSLSTDGGEEDPKVVKVEGPSCTVGGQSCSSVTVSKYDDPVRVSMSVINNGDEPLSIALDSEDVDKSDRYGRKLLTSKCNDEIARIDSYTVRKESNQGIETFSHSGEDASSPPQVIDIEEDTRMTVVWELDIPDDLNVSQLGYTCPLSFDLQFDQELSAGRQVQLKEGRNVPDADSLDRRFSSSFPVKMVIDAPKSAIIGEGRRLSVEGYLRNVGNGNVKEIENLDVKSDSWLGRNSDGCNPDNVLMYRSGERSGESYRKSCTVPLDFEIDSSSVVRWLRYEASYTYDMPVTPSTIKLKIEPVVGGSE